MTTASRRYPDRPFVGVGVVVWRGDKVLLVRRGKPPRQGEWSLPGGAQKLGETILDSARREVREETGLTVTPLSIITALDSMAHDAQGRIEYHYTLVEVAAESTAGEALAADDATHVCWATLDEVDALCAWPEVARVVRLSLVQRVLYHCQKIPI